MATANGIYVTKRDAERLQKLVDDAYEAESCKESVLEQLQNELDRANVVASKEVPANVVTMNSQIRLIDVNTKVEEVYTLVYPKDADIANCKLSVLAPIGTALLGYQVGDTVEWCTPSGSRQLTIDGVLYQPEASGDFDA